MRDTIIRSDYTKQQKSTGNTGKGGESTDQSKDEKKDENSNPANGKTQQQKKDKQETEAEKLEKEMKKQAEEEAKREAEREKNWNETGKHNLAYWNTLNRDINGKEISEAEIAQMDEESEYIEYFNDFTRVAIENYEAILAIRDEQV